MKYMLLICDDPALWPTDPAEEAPIHEEYGAFTQSIIESKELVGGDRLHDVGSATSVRVRDGRTSATDGPFAETKELLGGYYIVDVRDLDRAIELASQIPSASRGVIEVRPIWEMGTDRKG